jgi:hypothetical protein
MKTVKKEYITPAISETEIGNAVLASVSRTGNNVDFTGTTGSESADKAMTSEWTMPWSDMNTKTEQDY